MTASTREQLFSYCVDNGLNEDKFNDLMQIVLGEIHAMDQANAEMRRQKNETDRKHENLKQVFKETCTRNRSQLMSVFYLLGAMTKMGTHREKETAIRFLQQTVDDLVNKPDQMSWDQNWFEIPF